MCLSCFIAIKCWQWNWPCILAVNGISALIEKRAIEKSMMWMDERKIVQSNAIVRGSTVIFKRLGVKTTESVLLVYMNYIVPCL